MSLSENTTYRQDLLQAVSHVDVSILQNKSLLITGASGLICSAVVDLLLCCNQHLNSGIRIYAAGRSVAKMKKRFPGAEKYGVSFVVYDATKENKFPFSVDYIIHGASNASPDKYMAEPVDTMLANILGVHYLMDYAKSLSVEKVVYVSSSEVYGAQSHGKPLHESVYGTTDILSPRSSYPVGKQAAEALCISYANQYKVNVSIVRPGHIYGPTAQITDGRISSAFAHQAARGEDLSMKSAGTQIRSYCHCVDCATAILTVLTRGESKEAYNISNKNSIISIYEMASIVAECAGVKLQLSIPTEAEKKAFNPMDNSSLDSGKLEALGWTGMFDAYTGFAHTIEALREMTSDTQA